MKIVADVHLHSHFSRATSKNLNLENLYKWAQLKGVTVVGTGDITHPGWLKEMKAKLEPAEDGLFKIKNEIASQLDSEIYKSCRNRVRFMLAGEISNIYKRHDKVRKIHNVVFMPSFDALERFQARLEQIGNIRSDGRPILGLDSRDLLEIVLETDSLGYFIPAHIWTPWFAMFGSMSGFDAVEECFGDLTDHIFALETGLSSDPAMNSRLSMLDKYALVSNSDAHSPQKLAREANIFETELSYISIFNALKNRESGEFKGTVEFFPEEGKYHFDGHRKCGIRWDPKETLANDGMCPICGRKVTVGVMHRVETLADRENELPKEQRQSYKSLVPLPELLAEIYAVGVNSKRVNESLQYLLSKLGSELSILQDIPLDEIKSVGGEMVSEGIRRMRIGEINVKAGYDGEFGTIKLFEENERDEFSSQLNFFMEQVKEESAKKKENAGAAKARKKVERNARAITVRNQKARLENGKTENAIPLLVLNEQQKKAVVHSGSPLLVKAGPGTGKTQTLTHKIANLISAREASAKNILVVTFTNQAVEEMAARIQKLLTTQNLGDQPTICTFHSLAVKLLREDGNYLGLPQNFQLCCEEDKFALIKKCAPGLTKRAAASYLDAFATVKNRLLNISDFAGPKLPEAEKIWTGYHLELTQNGLLDFEDMLISAVQLLSEFPPVLQKWQKQFTHFFVDE